MLYLPDSLSIGIGVEKMVIEQTDSDFGIYFTLSSADTGVAFSWNGNALSNNNFIGLEFIDRTNRDIVVDVLLTSDSAGMSKIGQFKKTISLFFQDNATCEKLFLPSAVDIAIGDDSVFMNLYGVDSLDPPSAYRSHCDMRGYSGFGLEADSGDAYITLDPSKVAPASWDYAEVMLGCRDGNYAEAMAQHVRANGTTVPIRRFARNRPTLVVLKPNELITGFTGLDGYTRGFGCVYVKFFSVNE